MNQRSKCAVFFHSVRCSIVLGTVEKFSALQEETRHFRKFLKTLEKSFIYWKRAYKMSVQLAKLNVARNEMRLKKTRTLKTSDEFLK